MEVSPTRRDISFDAAVGLIKRRIATLTARVDAYEAADKAADAVSSAIYTTKFTIPIMLAAIVTDEDSGYATVFNKDGRLVSAAAYAPAQGMNFWKILSATQFKELGTSGSSACGGKFRKQYLFRFVCGFAHVRL